MSQSDTQVSSAACRHLAGLPETEIVMRDW
jgi:hypothetical protein